MKFKTHRQLTLHAQGSDMIGGFATKNPLTDEDDGCLNAALDVTDDL